LAELKIDGPAVVANTSPESGQEPNVNRQFWYTVTGDGEVLAENHFGAWILGRDDLDLPLAGVATLTLTTRATFDGRRPRTLFWGNPVIVTRDGRELPLADLDPVFAGIDTSPAPGKDYEGGPIKLQGRLFTRALPANPVESGAEGTITVDLSRLDAVRFTASVGGDYPVGDETQRRKTVAFRQDGETARFLTVIEPWEATPVVREVVADGPDRLRVMFGDGRSHEITIADLDADCPRVTVVERRAGKELRRETAGSET
jgi:hypothetical protein